MIIFNEWIGCGPSCWSTSLRIANNQQNIVINFHQDFVASTQSDFIQGQAKRGIFHQDKSVARFCDTRYQLCYASFYFVINLKIY